MFLYLPIIKTLITALTKLPKNDDNYVILAFEHALIRVLRVSSIFLIKVNNWNLLQFGTTTFSNHKILRGVMKKLFHPKHITLITPLGIFVIGKYSNPKL